MVQGLGTPEVLLDTDTLSHLMRRQPRVVERAREYHRLHGRLTLSLVTRYEILSGLKARRALGRIEAFNRFCTASSVLPLTDEIVEVGSDIYADLHRKGELIGVADLLIAATALVHGLSVVTNNERHFRRISGLTVGNWLRDSAYLKAQDGPVAERHEDRELHAA